MLRSYLLTSLVIGWASFSVASAQSQSADNPDAARPNSTLTKKVAEKQRAVGALDATPSSGGGPLTSDQIEKMLKDMGYEPRVFPYADKTGKSFEIDEGGWTLIVELSRNKANIWVSANLTKVDKPANNHSEKLFALLAANNTTDATFIYYPATQFIAIQRHVPNQNVTPSQIRKTAVAVATMMRATFDIWKADNFK
jgi:hypothetical protein